MAVFLDFDASLSEGTSGAAFKIECRDMEHARQVVRWLSSKADFHGCRARVPVIHEDFLKSERGV